MNTYKLDKQSIIDLLEFQNKINKTMESMISEIVTNGIYEGDLKELQNSINWLQDRCSEEKPYLNEKYNPQYGDDRICKCGHSYIRHFDSYEDFEPTGCKYCHCDKFEEMTEDDVLKNASDETKNLINIAKEIRSKKYCMLEITTSKDVDDDFLAVTSECFAEIKMLLKISKNFVCIYEENGRIGFAMKDELQDLELESRISFCTEGMRTILHGRVDKIEENYVIVKCKNGEIRYVRKNEIINIYKK